MRTCDLPVQDGFTHLTKDPAFLLGVANNFYRATTPWNWICLRIDPKKLSHEVLATSVLKGELFFVHNPSSWTAFACCTHGLMRRRVNMNVIDVAVGLVLQQGSSR